MIARTRIHALLAVALAALLLCGCPPAPREATAPDATPPDDAEDTPPAGDDALPDTFEARVTRVIDGDTVEIEGGEHVRYIGMDTPEMSPREPWAEEATAANRELVEGEMVTLTLDVERRDRYGRLLAYVHVDDTFVNAELVRRGLAQIMTVPPNVRHAERFLKLQRRAREQGRGMWAEHDPPTRTRPGNTQ